VIADKEGIASQVNPMRMDDRSWVLFEKPGNCLQPLGSTCYDLLRPPILKHAKILEECF
jgi:hypothetical protein